MIPGDATDSLSGVGASDERVTCASRVRARRYEEGLRSKSFCIGAEWPLVRRIHSRPVRPFGEGVD